jgi:hypothetical protein
MIDWRTKHGYAGTRTYRIWQAMKSRCYRAKDDNYKWYGARGIAICDRWRNSFENFLEDMGECPPGKMIDRINNEGNYEPSNCRWATIHEQLANRRNSVYFEIDGQRKGLKELATQHHLHKVTLGSRLRRGWNINDALSKAIKGRETHCQRGHDLAVHGKKFSDGRRRCYECIRLRNRKAA